MGVRTSSCAAASPTLCFRHCVSHLHCLLLQLSANALGHVLQHPDAARDQLQLLILLLHNQLGPKRRETGNYRSAVSHSWVRASQSCGQTLAAWPTSAVGPGQRPKTPGMRTAFLRNAGEVTAAGKPPRHGIPMAQQAAASCHPCKSSLSSAMPPPFPAAPIAKVTLESHRGLAIKTSTSPPAHSRYSSGHQGATLMLWLGNAIWNMLQLTRG